MPELLAAHARSAVPSSTPTARAGYRFDWPDEFARIPDEDWVSQPVEEFGLQYDTVENHGWYRNLDLTVEQLARTLREGDDPHRLLGRHRHPARPPAAARVRPAGSGI